jgi:DNA topoisomerase I
VKLQKYGAVSPDSILRAFCETADVPSNTPEWWGKMSYEERRRYAEEHPKSPLAKRLGSRDPHRGGGQDAAPQNPPNQQTNAPTHGAPRKGSAIVGLSPAPAERSHWPEHIRKLGLPPAWSDIRINPDPNSDLQAVGLDSKGRKQYVYSEKFAASQAAIKFARIHELAQKRDEVLQQIQQAQTSKDDVVREHGDCARLVFELGIRPGSDRDTGAEHESFGATTLLGQHVVSDENGTALKFVPGKKHLGRGETEPTPVVFPIHDPDLAEKIKARASVSGPDGRLFGKVSDASLRSYIHSLDGGSFKTKDMRTLLGTQTAQQLISEMDPPKNPSAYKKMVRDVAVKVAQRLGNTPAVALSSYISPTVFAPWHESMNAPAEVKPTKLERKADQEEQQSPQPQVEHAPQKEVAAKKSSILYHGANKPITEFSNKPLYLTSKHEYAAKVAKGAGKNRTITHVKAKAGSSKLIPYHKLTEGSVARAKKEGHRYVHTDTGMVVSLYPHEDLSVHKHEPLVAKPSKETSAAMAPHEKARKAAVMYDEKHRPILDALPHIPFGSYVGKMEAHTCHTNAYSAANRGKGQLYNGFVLSKQPDHPLIKSKIRWRATPHSFNVEDGKVVEHTKIHGFDPKEERHYFGAPVSKEDAKDAHAYHVKTGRLSWLRKQAGIKRKLVSASLETALDEGGTMILRLLNLKSASTVYGWMKANKIPNPVPSNRLHVTLFKNGKTFNWKCDERPIEVSRSEMKLKIVEIRGKRLLVLMLNNPILLKRQQTIPASLHADNLDNSAPHITLSYNFKGWQPPQPLIPIDFNITFSEERVTGHYALEDRVRVAASEETAAANFAEHLTKLPTHVGQKFRSLSHKGKTAIATWHAKPPEEKLKSAMHGLKHAPKAALHHAKHHIEHEIHTYKGAAGAIKHLASGRQWKHLESHHKKSLRNAIIHAGITAGSMAMGDATGSVGHLIGAFAMEHAHHAALLGAANVARKTAGDVVHKAISAKIPTKIERDAARFVKLLHGANIPTSEWIKIITEIEKQQKNKKQEKGFVETALGDSHYPFKPIATKFKNSYRYDFKTPNIVKTLIAHSGPAAHVFFHANSSFSPNGKERGKAHKVFSTVHHIVRHHLEKHPHIEKITFSGSKASDDNHAKIYDHFVSRIPGARRIDSGSITDYEVPREGFLSGVGRKPKEQAGANPPQHPWWLEDWWKQMSPDERKAYLNEHRNSGLKEQSKKVIPPDEMLKVIRGRKKSNERLSTNGPNDQYIEKTPWQANECLPTKPSEHTKVHPPGEQLERIADRKRAGLPIQNTVRNIQMHGQPVQRKGEDIPSSRTSDRVASWGKLVTPLDEMLKKIQQRKQAAKSLPEGTGKQVVDWPSPVVR